MHLGVLYEGGNEGGVVERGFSIRRINSVAEIITAAEVLPGSWKGKEERRENISLDEPDVISSTT